MGNLLFVSQNTKRVGWRIANNAWEQEWFFMAKLYLTIKFKFWRTSKSWTQKQMADYLSVELKQPVSRQRLHAWEHAQRSVDATVAMQISALLGISYKELVERK
jgi:DNA-binding XRE family transcriptional regulator